uniref:Uncharacterized protein n=1 Tax=Anguilla anguilla TaxID=7936 RepID=A0A0E9Y2F1_ANGAN
MYSEINCISCNAYSVNLLFKMYLRSISVQMSHAAKPLRKNQLFYH